MAECICKWPGVVFQIGVLLLLSAVVLSAQAQPPEPPGAFGPTLQLHAGWNMISSPIRSAPITNLQGDCLISNGPWWWTGTRYELSTTLEPAKGYWVKVGDTCTMEAISLDRRFEQTLPLVPGWNLISSSSSWNDTNTGDCKLVSGPWWWDGQKYQQITADQPLEGFKGYWVKVGADCIVDSVKSQASHEAWDDSLLPPGPPAVNEGLIAGLLQSIGLRQTTAAPQAAPAPVSLQDVRLIPLNAGLAELHLRGTGIARSELRLFNLAGDLMTDLQGVGSTSRVSLLAANGRPLANGVYLYLVIITSADGQMTSSEVRKILLWR
jgi:hypothetical protein